ncbi:iron dicitrate transport regulator FecR, partial [Acinetobacter baumannii]|nr:iron dicitrate transport regulator FecR [Acinetobacter baumannii]
MLRVLGLAAGVGGAAWLAREEGAILLADHRTAPGQRLAVELEDGSRLLLNTRSAVDVRFDAGQRLLRLRAGEILLESAAMHGRRDARPLIVATEHGAVQALGTRFTVRLFDGRTVVNV